MLNLRKSGLSSEELFARNYERLLGWSLHLTGGDRAAAEDLLHDVFVLLSLHRPDLTVVDNPEGYLYTMLRNLHISRLRRATRAPLRQLSVVEFDSADARLRTLSAHDQLLVREELRTVCRYACARKERAKSACALILRFFHGYYPSELARVLRTTRQAVDVRLLHARNEARVVLENPGALGFVDGTEMAPARASESSGSAADFLSELREMIFRSRRGDCPSPVELRRLYRYGDEAPAQERLAHFVSCRECLEEINRELGIPPLSERHPVDTITRESRGGRRGGDGGGDDGADGGADGGGDAGGGTGQAHAGVADAEPGSRGGHAGGDDAGGGGEGLTRQKLRVMRRRAGEVYEHKPRELCVRVNGHERGSQRVTSGRSELNLILDSAEPVSFVEVFSEQGTRLLMLPVVTPSGGAGQSLSVGLSDGRSLELSLRFRQSWCELRVLYHDATYDEVQTLARGELDLETAGPVGGDVSIVGRARRRLALSASFFGRHTPKGFWLKRGLVTSALALLVAAALLIWQSPPPQRARAAELLARAARAEEAADADAETVLHRTLVLEERDPGAGRTLKHRRVQVWRSAERGLTVRRVFDERGRLIAGEWGRSDGTRTVYRTAAKESPARAGGATAGGAAWDADTAWRWELSAREFAAHVGGAADAHVEERGDSYVINYEAPDKAARAPGVEASLSAATLVIQRDDLRAVVQSFTFTGGGAARELRLTEASYARLPKAAVAPAVFTPDEEFFASGAMRLETRPAQSAGPAGDVEPSSSSAEGGDVPASAALEVEVLRLLSEAGADLGEQITAARVGRVLRVEAIVETEQRKAEILRALAPVLYNPSVKIDVKTAAEAARSGPTTTPPVVEQVEAAEARLPADAELRRHLGGGAGADDEIARFASRVSSRSRRALQHAWALKRLAERFPPQELRAMDPAAKQKWLQMAREHASAVRREGAALHQELQPLFSPAAEQVGAPPSAGAIGDEADLIARAARLLELCSAVDPAVRAAFSVSARPSPPSQIKSREFWRSLAGVQALASQIERATHALAPQSPRTGRPGQEASPKAPPQ
ncbi:MAG TPA: sigma-70 family RNA polymerase sigma factor [Pyrinomonadaceae bacterium]